MEGEAARDGRKNGLDDFWPAFVGTGTGFCPPSWWECGGDGWDEAVRGGEGVTRGARFQRPKKRKGFINTGVCMVWGAREGYVRRGGPGEPPDAPHAGRMSSPATMLRPHGAHPSHYD